MTEIELKKQLELEITKNSICKKALQDFLDINVDHLTHIELLTKMLAEKDTKIFELEEKLAEVE